MGSTNNECLSVIPKVVTDSMNDAMFSPILDPEIKRVVFSLGYLKALGPDGLNREFYQKNWETVKCDLQDAVTVFFISGTIGDCINDTLVALLPKIPHPESIGQLRPISCCNTYTRSFQILWFLD